MGVGTPRQTQIPPKELPRYGADRLSGIRCIATHLKLEPPNEAALTAMAVQRLDSLVVLTLTGSGFQKRGGGGAGYVKEAYWCHLIPHPETAWQISNPMGLEEMLDQHFTEFVEELEADFQRQFVARAVDDDRDRVLVVGLETDQVTKQRYQDGIEEIIFTILDFPEPQFPSRPIVFPPS